MPIAFHLCNHLFKVLALHLGAFVESTIFFDDLYIATLCITPANIDLMFQTAALIHLLLG